MSRQVDRCHRPGAVSNSVKLRSHDSCALRFRIAIGFSLDFINVYLTRTPRLTERDSLLNLFNGAAVFTDHQLAVVEWAQGPQNALKVKLSL